MWHVSYDHYHKHTFDTHEHILSVLLQNEKDITLFAVTRTHEGNVKISALLVHNADCCIFTGLFFEWDTVRYSLRLRKHIGAHLQSYFASIAII